MLGASAHVQLFPEAFLQSQKEGGMILWRLAPSQEMLMYPMQCGYQCEMANSSIWLQSSFFLDACKGSVSAGSAFVKRYGHY